MTKDKKDDRDPRLETPTGYYLQHTDWLPENEKSTSFFSMRDTLFFTFLVVACFAVAAILWLKPPKILTYDAQQEQRSLNVPVKNFPKQLQNQASYDHRRFEEISDEDPSISGDEMDLPLKEPGEEPKPETMPPTIKSDLRGVINLILAAF